MAEKRHGLKKKDAPGTAAAQQAAAFDTPPPAKPIPGMAGNPPMPPGNIVKTRSGYTDEELATLETIPGWTPEDGVPSNLPDLLDDAQRAQQSAQQSMEPENLSPPVAIDTPPLEVPKAVNVEKLPEADKARIMAGIAEAHEQAERRASEQEALVQNLAPGASGVNEAISGANVRQIDITDDLEDDTYAGSDIPKTQQQTKRSRTGTEEGQIHTNCPHCSWDLNQPGIPEPDDADKQRYLQSILGQTSFQKHYPMFAGKMTIVLRELSPSEIDLCYKQAHTDRKSGRFDSGEDFLETLQRYRLCLQLVELKTPEIQHTFPLSAEAWADGEPVQTPTGTVLPQIEESLYADVIKNETLNRLLGMTLSRFNRLLTKLEANADNPNFWSETAQVS